MDNQQRRGGQQEAQIRERAHALWLEQGQPEGRDLEHWMEAERHIAGAEGPQPKDVDDNLAVLGKEGPRE